MPTTNLLTNRQASNSGVTDPEKVEHYADHDKLSTVVNYAAVNIRWNSQTLQWETRPSGVPFGVIAISTNDPAAVPPHTQAQTGFIAGDVWEWHPDGGPA